MVNTYIAIGNVVTIISGITDIAFSVCLVSSVCLVIVELGVPLCVVVEQMHILLQVVESGLEVAHYGSKPRKNGQNPPKRNVIKNIFIFVFY